MTQVSREEKNFRAIPENILPLKQNLTVTNNRNGDYKKKKHHIKQQLHINDHEKMLPSEMVNRPSVAWPLF